jgi:hypothetical protein
MSGRKIAMGAVLLLMLSIGVYAVAQRGATGNVPFPRLYRLLTMTHGRMIGPNSPNFASLGGLDYVYANRRARTGFDSRPFDEGSLLVNERMHAAESADGVWQEARTVFVAVMLKDRRRYPQTGGWGFNVFSPANPQGLTVEQARTQCFEACHKAQAQRDFVFSDFRQPWRPEAAPLLTPR